MFGTWRALDHVLARRQASEVSLPLPRSTMGWQNTSFNYECRSDSDSQAMVTPLYAYVSTRFFEAPSRAHFSYLTSPAFYLLYSIGIFGHGPPFSSAAEHFYGRGPLFSCMHIFEAAAVPLTHNCTISLSATDVERKHWAPYSEGICCRIVCLGCELVSSVLSGRLNNSTNRAYPCVRHFSTR